MRVRAARSAFSAVILAGLVAGCTSQPDDLATSNQPLLSGPHRVEARGMASVELLQKGGKLIADYGSYALIDIDGAQLSGMAKDSYQLRDEYRNVLLNAGAIDALDPASQGMRQTALPTSGRQLHLIQFAGPVKADWYAQLQGAGVRVVAYVPHDAYLVYGGAAELSRLISYGKSAPEVQWDGPYLNDYKINPAVYAVAKADGYQVQLVEDAQGNADTLARAAAMDRKGLIDQRALGYVNLVVHADLQSVLELSKQADVVSIYPFLEPKKLDERADMVAAGQLTPDGSAPTGPGYLAWLASKGFTQAQFDATNVGVDISDSGLDNGTQSPNAFPLYKGGDVTGTSRVLYNRLVGTPNSGSTIQGCDGHGTLNSNIIMAYNNVSGAPHQDALGFHYNLGIAPFARIGSSVIFDPGSFTFPNYENLQSMAYRDGMRVSSNSWGASVAGAYNSDSQRYDALVRDAQPSGSTVPAPGNQEMIIVFAAGNSGSGAQTVGSPGTAKNIITAGAANGVQPFGAADQCGVGDVDADSANDIVFFSSRGPCTDGRIKPDLVAAGTHVSGGVAQSAGQHANPPGQVNGEQLACFDASGVCAGPGTSNFWPLNQQWTTASSGTSHSTPLIAGAALMTRQWLITNTGTTPSATLVKAWLINSARYMTGSGANDNLYSNNQGMGHLNLGTAVDGTARFTRDENPADLFTATGQTRTFNVFASDPAKPFRVTLAWTDAPGSTTGNAFNNNLDLTVAIGGNTYKGNVFTGRNSVTGGVADTRNNVESVFLPAGTTGPATITVTATNINSDGVPNNASPLDQDFALVAYNVCGTQGTPPSGVTATVSGLNQIQIDWTASTGTVTDYHVYRGTTAGGPYTQVGSVAVPATTFTDTTVSGGTTYFYVVRGVNCAESVNSNEASATATGDCRLPPGFAGLTTAANAGAATCGVNLTWPAATPSCGGPITYSVYRSRTTGFTPSAANRVATGVSGTTFADAANLTFPNTYYYVVHAVETSGASTNEDGNLVQKSVAPTGPVTPAVRYFDDLDGNRPANAAAYWLPSATTINTTTGCRFQSTSKAWRFGNTATTCGGVYPINREDRLVLGGDGTTAGINGFVIPPNTPTNASTATLTFSHAWQFENNFDGAFLEYSTSGAAGPWTTVPGSTTAGSPYIVSGTYNGHATSNRAAWTSNAAYPANGSFNQTVVNADALAGRTVWFAWHYVSDVSITFEGHYLDDVRFNVDSIGGCTAGAVPPGPAVAYSVTLPASSAAGAAVTANLTATDSTEQVAAGYSGTANLTSSDPQATTGGTATFASGVATASVIFGTVGVQSLTATDQSNSALTGTGGTTVTPGAPAALRFSVQPSNATAGAAIAPAVKVRVVDAFGNLVPTATDSITVALGNNPGGGTLRGTLTASAVAGVATFSDLNVQEAGTGYTLSASSGALASATSGAFDITADLPVALRFAPGPADSVAGVPFSPAVAVESIDQFGNVNRQIPVTVLMAIRNNPSNGVLLGTPIQDTVNGVATFTDLAVTKVGTGYTLAAGAFFGEVVSGPFAISPNVPHHLTISQQPSDTTVGVPTSSVVVAVRDFYENLATQSSAPISATLSGGASGARLLGTTAVSATAGIASFDDLAVDRVGQAYTLQFGSTGLYSATTVGFDVAPGAAAVAVEFVTQPSDATAGSAISPAITVRVVDGSGNTVIDASEAVTLALGANPGGGTLGGGLSSTPVNGVATFSNVSISKVGTGYTLVASSGSLAADTSTAFDVTPAAGSHLAFGSQPSNSAAGRTIAPAVTVEARDAFGNVDTGFTGQVTLLLGGGNPNAVLSGTTSASAVAGVATFSDLSVNKAGKNYTLSASASGLLAATSSPFVVSSGPPSKLVIGGLGFSATSFVAVPFSVSAYDDQDNLAVDYAGTASVKSDDAAATLPPNVTFSSGVAPSVAITFKTTGVHTVTVTDTTQTTLTTTANLVVTNFPQPTVSISDPANGSSVTGTVTITATGAVASGTTLTKLEIFVDGTSMGSSATSPATASWDASKLKSGTTHLIHAVVSDAAGNTVQSTPLTVIIGQQGCGCTTGAGGLDMGLLAAVGAALRAVAIRRRRRA